MNTPPQDVVLYCDFGGCRNDPTHEFLVANLDAHRNPGTRKVFCHEHLELARKTYVVNRETELSTIECQWAVHGICHNPPIRLLERRMGDRDAKESNVGKLQVCWRHLDEAVRSYPHDLGPIEQ